MNDRAGGGDIHALRRPAGQPALRAGGCQVRLAERAAFDRQAPGPIREGLGTAAERGLNVLLTEHGPRP